MTIGHTTFVAERIFYLQRHLQWRPCHDFQMHLRGTVSKELPRCIWTWTFQTSEIWLPAGGSSYEENHSNLFLNCHSSNKIVTYWNIKTFPGHQRRYPYAVNICTTLSSLPCKKICLLIGLRTDRESYWHYIMTYYNPHTYVVTYARM